MDHKLLNANDFSENAISLMDDLVSVVDKYVDTLSYSDISEQLIAYGTRMMLSVAVDELSGFKGTLSHVVAGLEEYEKYGH